MREFEGELEVLDVTEHFTNCDVQMRKGLTKWKVMIENKNNEKELLEIKGKDDPIFKDYKYIVEESCFPQDIDKMEKHFKIQNCVRILPHDSDTGIKYNLIFRWVLYNSLKKS